MTVEIRPITPDEQAPFSRRLSAAFSGDATDERIEASRGATEHDRTLSGWDGGELVATAGAFTFEVTLPGGSTLPAAGVTAVSVAPTHRRQGILRRMMDLQLDDVAARGEPLALLTASEGAIYGRFGYGPATWYWSWELRTDAEVARPSRAGGRIRTVEADDWLKVVPPIFDRARRRFAGEVSSPEHLWTYWGADHEWDREGTSRRRVAIHESDGGEPDGYVSWRVASGWTDHALPNAKVHVEDLYGLDDEVEAALLQHLLGIDLVTTVHVEGRVDDPFRWRLADPRRLQVGHQGDHLWVRVLDVAAALWGRAYEVDDALVLGLADPFRPANAGTWRVASDGTARTDADADLELDVADLGSVYLGGVKPSVLAGAGRVVERTPGALARADRLFASSTPTWCGTHF